MPNGQLHMLKRELCWEEGRYCSPITTSSKIIIFRGTCFQMFSALLWLGETTEVFARMKQGLSRRVLKVMELR